MPEQGAQHFVALEMEPTTSDEVAGSSDTALGYRYWTGKPGDGVEAPAPKPVPKKLSQEELAQTAKSGASSGGSAWNKVKEGTSVLM